MLIEYRYQNKIVHVRNDLFSIVVSRLIVHLLWIEMSYNNLISFEIGFAFCRCKTLTNNQKIIGSTRRVPVGGACGLPKERGARAPARK
jgi:hypothetical protein